MMDAERIMLLRKIDNLTERLEITTRERDALLRDLSHGDKCQACVHTGTKPGAEPCSTSWKIPNGEKDCFVWRGVQENGGAEDA